MEKKKTETKLNILGYKEKENERNKPVWQTGCHGPQTKRKGNEQSVTQSRKQITQDLGALEDGPRKKKISAHRQKRGTPL